MILANVGVVRDVTDFFIALAQGVEQLQTGLLVNVFFYYYFLFNAGRVREASRGSHKVGRGRSQVNRVQEQVQGVIIFN